MSSTPDIDPYAVLGVAKDATLPDIKSAHRKLVLKCHPDKIKDESLRSQAQDEFQKVQQAYELLSDDTRRTKYDQKVRIAELRREMMARGVSARASSSREYHDGRIYEERTPAGAAFDDSDDSDAPYKEEPPRTTSRKFDEFSARPRTKGTDERRKSKTVPVSSARAARESARDSTKATHSNRDKDRTKARRRDMYEKYERRAAPSPYVGTEDRYDDSDSSTTSVHVRVKYPSSSKRNRAASRKTKTESARYDDYSDEDPYKYDKQEFTARDYISRSGGTVPVEIDRRHRSSRSPSRRYDYDDEPEPESSSSRRSGRSKRSSKENVHSSSSRHSSYEDLDPRARGHDKVTPMPSAATSAGIKFAAFTRPSLQATRSAGSYSRPSKRESSSRSTLHSMVYGDGSRTVKMRGDRSESTSTPATPEMPSSESPKTSSTRFRVPKDAASSPQPETVYVDYVERTPPHPSPRHTRTWSPTRTGRMPKPTRSHTAPFVVDAPSSRYESVRPSGPSRHQSSSTSSGRAYFNEVDYISRPRDKDVKYREISPPNILRNSPRCKVYDDYRSPAASMGRRQSAAAAYAN